MIIVDMLKQPDTTIWINKSMPGVEFTQTDIDVMITLTLKKESLKSAQVFASRFEIKEIENGGKMKVKLTNVRGVSSLERVFLIPTTGLVDSVKHIKRNWYSFMFYTEDLHSQQEIGKSFFVKKGKFIILEV